MQLSEQQAFTLVKAALDAGLIKLNGPVPSDDGSVRQAKADAVYLRALMADLQKATTPTQP
jgi:hypothetical protein